MSRASMTITVLASSLVVAACEEKAPHALKGATTKQAAAPAGAKEGARREANPCFTLQEQARAVLAKAKTACQADADCACYPAIADCGGVTDAKTANRLRTLARLFALARCTPPSCPAREPCGARCVAGACRRQARAARVEKR